MFRYNKIWNGETVGHSTGTLGARFGVAGRRKFTITNGILLLRRALTERLRAAYWRTTTPFTGLLVTALDYKSIAGFIPMASPFYGADGSNAWDINVTESDGTHVDGHSPYLFESGTLTSGTSGNSLIDSSKSWTTNHWAGYSVKRTSDGATALIISNTSTTLTVAQWIRPKLCFRQRLSNP